MALGATLRALGKGFPIRHSLWHLGLKQVAQRLELQPEREAVEEYEAALAELWQDSLGKVWDDSLVRGRVLDNAANYGRGEAMAEHEDDPAIAKLRFSLGEYEDARLAWQTVFEAVEREREARERSGKVAEPSDERQLYKFARDVVDSSYLGDLPRGGATGELARRARRYLIAFERLSITLETMSKKLEDVSSEEAGP
jgi:hypothetical protein